MTNPSNQIRTYKTEGYLITYNSSQPSDITKINHFLFGRIANVQKEGKIEKYYYPGLFEDQQFKKLSNGCYFVGSVSNDCDGLLNYIPVLVTFSDKEMITARDYWKDKVKGKIHNW